MESFIIYNEGVKMYTKYVWTSGSKLTAELLNHLETQYDEFMSILSTHNHDTSYYTKQESDAKYFHTGHMGYGSGADADLLDGYHLSQILGDVLPVGSIVIWKGTAGTIPSGWVICDGSNGTPDLRDRFVMGGTLSQIGGTGGRSTITDMGGTVTTSGTSLSINQIPYHYHKYSDYYGAGGPYPLTGYSGLSTTVTDNARTTGSTGSGSAHDHGSFSVTFNSFSNIPPYYALYYIKKVS